MSSAPLSVEVNNHAHLTDLEREAMLSSATVGVVFTRQQTILHANPFFERMFEYKEGELAGKHVSIVFPSLEAFNEVNNYSAPLFSQQLPVELEKICRRNHGTIFWCRMLGQVINSTDTTLKGVIWIVEDISERKAFEERLKKAAEKAEAANQAKSLFLANTSHELRTPLNGLIGLATLAQRKDVPPKLRDQYLNQIVEIAKNLNGIVTNILDLTKIESSSIELEQLPFLLSFMLQTVHGTFNTAALSKNLTFEIEIKDDVQDAVIGDSTKLIQILSNYVNNAIKFTDAGSIKIVVSKNDSFTRFSVYDTGIGIPKDVCNKLFTPFTQADGSITRKYGGTGLGLSICKQIAELMGGRIGVESTVDVGSCFWAEIPLSAIADTEPNLICENLVDDLNTKNFEILDGKTVVVIEDNPINMLITTALLEQQKINVIGIESGEDAIKKLASDIKVDCILSDLHMPGLSGHETARYIRQMEHRKTTPIIALTAAAFLEEKQKALASGMTSFLTKPVDANTLYREIAIQISTND